MIEVLKPGLLTSVQDLGRMGYQKYGVIASGVMDPLAHRIANLLVGNPEHEATLELTLLGPELEFQHDHLIAICGGDLTAKIDGEAVKTWRPVIVKKGSVLSFKGTKSGCRAYLAVAGGLNIDRIMESQSTYLRAGIGGFDGRALQKGDQLEVKEPSTTSRLFLKRLVDKSSEGADQTNWAITAKFTNYVQQNSVIRVIQGKQFHLLNEDSKEAIFDQSFKITPQSDRMGYRIEGQPLELDQPTELASEAVSFGTVQLPSDGQPIILLADRQTTGGYPKVAQVASVDLPKVAQLKPGMTLRFQEVTLEEAQRIFLKREEELLQLKKSIFFKMKED